MIAGVGHEEVAGGVDRHGPGALEAGVEGGAVGGAEIERRAGKRADGAIGSDAADCVVAGVGDVEVAGAIAGEAERKVETRGGADPVGRSGGAERAGNRGDDTGRRDAADGVVVGVGDVEVAGVVAREALRIIETRVCPRAVHRARRAGRAGYGRDLAGRGDAADGVVVEVGDEEVAGGVEGQAARPGEVGGGAGAIGLAGGCGAVLGKHGAGGGELPDRVVVEAGDIDGAGGINRHAGQAVGRRAGGAERVRLRAERGAGGGVRQRQGDEELLHVGRTRPPWWPPGSRRAPGAGSQREGTEPLKRAPGRSSGQ
jgi:hypothetical protein